MTPADESIQLPDGEELVVIEDSEWRVVVSHPDPREKSLDLRRQVVRALPKRSDTTATT